MPIIIALRFVVEKKDERVLHVSWHGHVSGPVSAAAAGDRGCSWQFASFLELTHGLWRALRQGKLCEALVWSWLGWSWFGWARKIGARWFMICGVLLLYFG